MGGSRGKLTCARMLHDPAREPAPASPPRSEVAKPVDRSKNILAGSCIDHPVREPAEHAPIGGAMPLAMRRTDVVGHFLEMPRVEEPQAMPAALSHQPELAAKDRIDRREHAWSARVNQYKTEHRPPLRVE